MPNTADPRRSEERAHQHSRTAAELPVVLDRRGEESLPVQLAAALRAAIDGGALLPGEPVAASREQARRLGVARGVVVAAYEQLIAEGYLTAAHGRGTRVHPELRTASAGPVGGARPASGRGAEPIAAPDPGPASGAAGAAGSARGPAGPLTPGLPDISAVDTPAWRAAWRSAAARAHLRAPDLGDPALRSEIAEHMRRMRGTARPAEDIIVTAGTREGLGLLMTALGTTGGRRLVIGVEDPGYPSLRRVAARHGAEIVALPVDVDGLDTGALPEGLLDAVIVTPSHQYPLGGSLPLARRRQLLEWAVRGGAVIVEDDYDSELRHAGSPLPALAALDDPVEGSVVLLGTFSKTVSQSLSAGFLLAPRRLRALVEPVRRDLGGPVPAVVQTALAAYLGSGELRRHTARMRRRYAARREAVVEKLLGVPGARVRTMSGGLHAVVQFGSSPETERQVLAASDAVGLGAVPLSAYWQQRTPGAMRYGLVIGTGGADDARFARALTALRAVLLAADLGGKEAHPGV
ncbi:PLP-dependent aminotransferase family protein [Leucobacter weissii]|uniref:PLP-dependent aminotransferase family protein n=1 Tax=Leucobacter weissii TaxID=1983706 RepID=A0A939ML75_9MICO|nr:PLP-dependent aminotransferase family protein [Leucobacter weissii]MBO1900857.1 PLP-dependent aminotransferase family protein [Leucobacter weissii]